MGRKHYRNGDDVGLSAIGCDGCSPVMVCGELVHERGCPDAWRDYDRECVECGFAFTPQDRDEVACPICVADAEQEQAEIEEYEARLAHQREADWIERLKA